MAAVSCADTQIPETTVATQSLPKVGFRKAIQLEVLVIRIEAKYCSKIQQHHYAAIALGRFMNSWKRVAANRKFCCSLIGRSLLVCRGFWFLTYDSVRLPCARYVKSTTPTLTLSRCAAAPGTGTRLADRRATQPYLLSPFRS